MTRLQSQVLGSLEIALCLLLLTACANKDSPFPEIRNNVTVDPKLHREHIKNSSYRIPADGVIPLTHPEDKFAAGITLQKFPTQIFQCPAQRKVQFN